jgi:hypothetical protein
VIDAFGKGYLELQRLTLTELEMLPQVLRLRGTTSLFFRLDVISRALRRQQACLGTFMKLYVMNPG